jgi:hypothetical protein
MTDDITTTDREEAGCPFWQEQHGCAIAIDQQREIVTYTYGGSTNDPATILADIEEGKRKDAEIERLTRERNWFAVNAAARDSDVCYKFCPDGSQGRCHQRLHSGPYYNRMPAPCKAAIQAALKEATE